MSCRRWVVSASGIACGLKRNWTFLSASPTFQRVVENIERGKRALVSLKIRLESCINEQLKTNPPEMIWWWSYDDTGMNCVRVKCLVFLILIHFFSIRQTFRATRRLFRTMEEKIEVCNGHLPADCVDETWFPGSRIASDCNVYFHLLPSIHFTLKIFYNGTWITKAILFNFLLKILHTFRFPIHSERTAGNREIQKRKWPSTATRLYYVKAGTRDENFRSQCLCVSLLQSYPEGGRRMVVTKVKAFWVGQEQTARFWPPISALL